MSDPWMKFYTSDWRSDPRLKMCSPAARGMWIEMICLMHEATPYGHLLIHGQSPNEAQLASLTGIPSAEVPDLIGELERLGVFSRTREGVVYSRKLVRMAAKAALERKSGQKGGNPKLKGDYNKSGYVYVIGTRSDGAVKIGISVNPANRIKKIRVQYPSERLQVVGQVWVEDMGAAEAIAHRTLAGKKVAGEWFAIGDNPLQTIREILDPKGSRKGDPAPQIPDTRIQKESPLPPKGASFADFWASWPNKTAKAQAEKAWKKLSPAGREAASSAAVAWFADWRRRHPDASPIHPASYLNQRRWEDERASQPKAVDRFEVAAINIRSGKPFLCSNISASLARELISRGMVTETQCKEARVI